MKRRLIYSLTALILVAAAAWGIWYYASHHKSSKPQGQPATSQNQPSNSHQQSQPSQPNKTYPVAVYFSKHPDSDNDPGKTFPVQRTSPDQGVAKFAITQLLSGPSATESSQGYFTTARLRPDAANSDFRLSLNNGVATLQFLKPFDHLGVVADGQADSEIKASLKQFSTIQKVIILNYKGNCEFDLSGQDLCKQ